VISDVKRPASDDRVEFQLECFQAHNEGNLIGQPHVGLSASELFIVVVAVLFTAYTVPVNFCPTTLVHRDHHSLRVISEFGHR
jgi:hypothetical protein